MHDTFEYIIKPTFEEHLYPLLTQLVSSHLSTISIRDQWSIPDLISHLDHLHSLLLQALFKSDPKSVANMDSTADDLINDNESTDSFGEDAPPGRLSFLQEKLLEVARSASGQYSGNPKLKAMIEEFLDLMESEYMESAIFETLEASF